MTEKEKKHLKLEIAHIFESGANEIRIFEMVVNFIDSRNGVNKNFRLGAVSGRSELLLAFVEHIKKGNELTETVNANDVESFIKSQLMSSFYTDGIDHSNLEVNSHEYPEHEECVFCGSDSVTITDDKDICHGCGYVYE